MLQEALKLVDQHFPKDAKTTKLQLQLNYYQTTKNWEQVAKLMGIYTESFGYENGAFYNQVCWGIYEECDDEETIQQAARWMKKAIEITPDYYFVDTYAALLFKGGNLESAKKYALQAIEIGNEGEMDVSYTEELLEKINEAATQPKSTE